MLIVSEGPEGSPEGPEGWHWVARPLPQISPHGGGTAGASWAVASGGG
jgi:hypothetical protein